MRPWILAALAVLLTGCATDPFKQYRKLSTVEGELRPLLDEGWPAYVDGVEARADRIEKIAKTCADPNGLDSAPLLRVACYRVSAQGYALLTDVPSRKLDEDAADPAGLIPELREKARPVCSADALNGDCQAIAVFETSALTRRISSDLADYATADDVEAPDPDTIITLLFAFEEAAREAWPAALNNVDAVNGALERPDASAQRLEFERQACFVSHYGLFLETVDGAELGIDDARTAAVEAAASALDQPLCPPGQPACDNATACDAGVDTPTCRDARARALRAKCNATLGVFGALE